MVTNKNFDFGQAVKIFEKSNTKFSSCCKLDISFSGFFQKT